MENEREIVVCGVPFETGLEREALLRLKDLGVTSVQIYTFWKKFEPTARGQFDWHFYDREVDLIREAGLKYVPFLLMGPKYAAPQWWLESPQHVGLRCLEHGKESRVESIWNPCFREEISRVLAAFAGHYLPMGVLESVQPGICGDYGEAIMPVVGNWPGDYHTHAGYWCAGEDAQASFHAWIAKWFDSIETLNTRWGSRFAAFNEVKPFLPHKAPSRTAYFDFLEWYRGSMTEYADFWMGECRRLFPETPVYLCTGGMEEPGHASSFSSQARIAAKHHGGIRLTNEGNKFYDNFFMTAYTRSACDLYGAYLGLEPVGPMTDKGVVARIFGSVEYGNHQMFHYYGNLLKDKARLRPAGEALRKYLPLLKQRPLNEAVAFFWPGLYAAWNGGMPDGVKQALRFIRQMTYCLPVNEEMIMDGALSRHRLLVLPVSAFTSQAVLHKIAGWVSDGGVVFQNGLMREIELERVPEYDEMFGILPDSEEAWGIATQYIQTRPDFPAFSQIGDFTSGQSWLGLASDVEMLASTHAEEGFSNPQIKLTSAAFMRSAGQGKAIFYNGPVNFTDDPEAVFFDPGTYKALLQDVLTSFSQTADLTPGPGEIARTRLDGITYALKDGEIIPLK